MPTYLIRTNCEYSTEVEADTPEEAIEVAEKQPLKNWDRAWSEYEVDTDYDPDEPDTD